METTPSENKELVARYLEAVSGKRKTPEIVAPFVADPELQAHVQEVEAAFPAYELISEQMIAEADLVVVRGVFRGVHRGTFAGMSPTGKTVSAGLIIVYRIAAGRIVEHWLQFDLFGLMRQLALEPVAAAV